MERSKNIWTISAFSMIQLAVKFNHKVHWVLLNHPRSKSTKDLYTDLNRGDSWEEMEKWLRKVP